MLKGICTAFRISCFVLCFTGFALCHAKETTAENSIQLAEKQLQKLLDENKLYLDQKGSAFFKKLSTGQDPNFTILSCSDSRVQTNLVGDTPEGDIFNIRNIGNQAITAAGSIKYGVLHLHTPLLLIIGHSKCGAIDAANASHAGLEPSLIKELSTIHIKNGISNIDGVIENVNNQVIFAMSIFQKQIQANKLLVVGAVFDFSDEMHKGAGKLNVINIQGKKIGNI
jgi:carbonic anhydrase